MPKCQGGSLVQNWVKAIAKTGFGLANTGVNATIGRANKVLLHGESISLPPGLTGLPRNLSALPANIRDAIPDIIARWAPIPSSITLGLQPPRRPLDKVTSCDG